MPLGDIVPVNGYWIDADIDARGNILFVGQSATDPYEIYRLPAEGGTPVALTHLNAGLADLALARQDTMTWKGTGGRTLTGVITYPAEYQTGRRYPLVLYIHGGPNSNSRQRFNLMPQLLAGHGWLVFEPNYRGGDDQGNAFYASIYKDAGQGPGEDVMAGVEELKHRGLIDPQRMAVTGWSYGGFMTTWLAGHYPVWKAAVAGATRHRLGGDVRSVRWQCHPSVLHGCLAVHWRWHGDQSPAIPIEFGHPYHRANAHHVRYGRFSRAHCTVLRPVSRTHR